MSRFSLLAQQYAWLNSLQNLSIRSLVHPTVIATRQSPNCDVEIASFPTVARNDMRNYHVESFA